MLLIDNPINVRDDRLLDGLTPVIRMMAQVQNSQDKEIIKAANRGISSKNLPEADNRGFGIKTSKQMLINELNGQYLMVSGSYLYAKSKMVDSFYSMPKGFRWHGIIVALRVPYYSPTFNSIVKNKSNEWINEHFREPGMPFEGL